MLVLVLVLVMVMVLLVLLVLVLVLVLVHLYSPCHTWVSANLSCKSLIHNEITWKPCHT